MPTAAESPPRRRLRRQKQRKRRSGWRWGIAALLAGGAFVAALGPQNLGMVFTSPGGAVGSAVRHIFRIPAIVTGMDKTTNILLIGNNARNATSPLSIGTGGGQADILMVAHIDPTAKKVVLISIPRNVLIAMPNWRNPIPKIKGTFFLGAQEKPNQGPQMAMKAVSRLIGMPIQQYVVTDFQGFIDAINAVGGIQMNVPCRIYDPLHSHANLYPGVQTLNGQQALAWIRVRQNTAAAGCRVNDFQRMQAEAQMLSALKAKLLNPGADLTNLPGLISTWVKDVRTNVSTSQLVTLGMEIQGYQISHLTLGSIHDSMQLASAPLPGVNAMGYLTGAYYDVLDPARIYHALQPYGSSGSSTGLPSIPSNASVPVAVYGSAFDSGLLQKAGFPTTLMSLASAGVGQVTVLYPPGQMAWGWAVGRALGNGNELVAPGAPGQNRVWVEVP